MLPLPIAEVEMDKNRTWCPRAGCDTVCLMDSSNMPSSSAGPATITVLAAASSSKGALVVYAVRCPTCAEEFCSACKKTVSWRGTVWPKMVGGGVKRARNAFLVSCCSTRREY